MGGGNGFGGNLNVKSFLAAFGRVEKKGDGKGKGGPLYLWLGKKTKLIFPRGPLLGSFGGVFFYFFSPGGEFSPIPQGDWFVKNSPVILFGFLLEFTWGFTLFAFENNSVLILPSLAGAGLGGPKLLSPKLSQNPTPFANGGNWANMQFWAKRAFFSKKFRGAFSRKITPPQLFSPKKGGGFSGGGQLTALRKFFPRVFQGGKKKQKKFCINRF